MSDTVTIHNGHCSYHGPAGKAPAWARGQIPAPTTSFEDTTHAWEEGYRAGVSNIGKINNAPSGDLISRSAAIAAIEVLNHGCRLVRSKQSVTARAVAALRTLPAAPTGKEIW